MTGSDAEPPADDTPRAGTNPPREAAPVCPRHPDTVAYVRCQRCNRPVCPQCQVPGAVGVHCVDCARRAAASQRGLRSLLGGRAVADVVITKALIAACAAVYLMQLINPSIINRFAFAPVVADSQPWRFITTAFLHGSLPHLAFNMWALWVLGHALEPILGRWRFIALYLLSAVGGSTMIYWLASPSTTAWLGLTVGASGAVFGLFAALFIIQRRFGRDTSAILALLVINLAVSFVGAGISWQGHLGGLATGALIASLYAWAPRARRTIYGVWGTIGIAAALVGLIVLRVLVTAGS